MAKSVALWPKKRTYVSCVCVWLAACFFVLCAETVRRGEREGVRTELRFRMARLGHELGGGLAHTCQVATHAMRWLLLLLLLLQCSALTRVTSRAPPHITNKRWQPCTSRGSAIK